MYKTKSKLILASGSPRRRELLGRMGLEFEVRESGVEENGLDAAVPEQFCRGWAEKKAQAVAERPGAETDGWFLGVDTIVVVDGLILGKPRDQAEARKFLGMIAGRWHIVLSGYCLIHPASGVHHLGHVESGVNIKALTGDEIAAYAATGEPMDKAGAYAVQGIGAFMVRAIRGSWTNVVGLPLTEVVDDLQRLGAIELVTKT